MARFQLPLLCLLAAATGCVGTIRDTTTPRTATETLLVSTAAERAVVRWEVAHLAGKKVFLDDKLFESIDKNYVIAALQDHLAGAGVLFAAKPDDSDLTLEIRCGGLGLWDGDFNLGIPALPVSFNFPPVRSPELALFRRLSQQGYAMLQVWLYDSKTLELEEQSPDLWGHAFYNTWWVFGIGPFDGSNDIYPEVELTSYLPGDGEDEGD